jgi:hypothetical protein
VISARGSDRLSNLPFVVNGKFSGQITYTTNATAGRIDIFASRADGSEYSNIEIPVRFK